MTTTTASPRRVQKCRECQKRRKTYIGYCDQCLKEMANASPPPPRRIPEHLLPKPGYPCSLCEKSTVTVVGTPEYGDRCICYDGTLDPKPCKKCGGKVHPSVLKGGRCGPCRYTIKLKRSRRLNERTTESTKVA